MLNDKRLCQLMLPCYILFRLAAGGEGKREKAICRYVSKHMTSFCGTRDKMFKISLRIGKVVKQIEYFCADKDLLKGNKMILVTYFLTQLIFNEKEGKINQTYLEIAKITQRLVEFCAQLVERNVKEDEFEKILKSSEKLANKVYEKFYKII